MFCAGHEPTQDSAFGEGHNSTQRQCVRCGARVYPKQWFRCGARVHPNRPRRSLRRERAARWPVRIRYCYLQRSWGLSTPRLKIVKQLWSYSVAGPGKRARKIGDAVGVAFALLKFAIERGDKLKLMLD